ncbi:hypothetical protein LshimejAT787_0201860 [Lyophyllum shimeji]|uniref:Uncharacterized protein n=1 Tax=Lyophyllum shimeji TaxID=47721 RepID=A0A9P3PFP8_LYOSH|nr:hypothetical protein LshimejAT787_0201860 [Lyophyllum shimeji]
MPEQPENRTMKTWVEKAAEREEKRTGMPAQAFLLLLPRCFSEGTASKKYGTCTANTCPGLDKLEPLDPAFIPNEYDLKRSKRMPWEHLVDRPTIPGPLCCEVRGKAMVIAAGYHAVTINFGLEAHLIVMSRDDFYEILAGDRPGPNADAGKARRLRSFTIPDRMVEAGTSTRSDRYVNMFAAFVMKTQVIVVVDFSRLVRLDIRSQTEIYHPSHISIKSPLWRELWKAFPDGPDFIREPEEALQALKAWRLSVQNRRPGWQHRMVDVLALNSNRAFGGFGRHLANDFLYLLGEYPSTPAYVFCDSDLLFDRLCQAIPQYMSIWSSPDFLQKCAGLPNSWNPFAFNAKSDKFYTSGYLYVFRKRRVRMPAYLYNLYLNRGLFDKDHIIGTPYCKACEPCVGMYKDVDVRYLQEPVDAFTVITAQPPAEWGEKVEEKHFDDITTKGYTTTIGPAQFHEPKQNMLNLAQGQVILKAGAPKKLRTGAPGRPRKTITKAKIEKAQAALARKRVLKVRPSSSKEKENVEVQALVEEAVGRLTRQQARLSKHT